MYVVCVVVFAAMYYCSEAELGEALCGESDVISLSVVTLRHSREHRFSNIRLLFRNEMEDLLLVCSLLPHNSHRN